MFERCSDIVSAAIHVEGHLNADPLVGYAHCNDTTSTTIRSEINGRCKF